MFSLLENSITHGIASHGEVEVQATRRNNNIEIKFQDNGCGMDEEALKHAFDPFFSTQFGQGSSGLGLYRVYNLITVVMGGSIRARFDENFMEINTEKSLGGRPCKIVGNIGCTSSSI